MSTSYELRIHTPEKIVFDGAVVSLNVPGGKGSFAVLAHHVPLVSTLVPGPIVLIDRTGKRTGWESQGRGFIDVRRDKVTVLVEAVQEQE